MPTYEFKCETCGKEYTRDYLMDKCPKTVKCECNNRAVKIISAVAISIPSPVSEARVGRGKG